LEAARAERMRQNGHGTITLEDARTWIEETGLCLFLPRRQFSSSIAPSFVEAVAGQRDATPNPQQIAAAEELLVRLELDGVAVRLNLLGQPGEQPDFVVAGWVLPYVYALRGDRDWRRSPQLTGSRQVSPLAVQAYKLLETNETNISVLTHTLGREVTEAAVLRAITELWQQLRIIPVIDAPGKAARWQLLRLRFQKAIAEGASTSQVTAISVLASIYLQAVIAATMEEVEIFLSPLTARSKVREVLRGLVATRQVHTISMGHAPHFYVAGTLPEFAAPISLYASASLPPSAYFMLDREEDADEFTAPMREERVNEPVFSEASGEYLGDPAAVDAIETTEAKTKESAEPVPASTPRAAKPAPRNLAKPEAARPRFTRPAEHARERKPAHASSSARPARRPGSDSRSAGTGPSNGSRPASGGRSASGTRPASGNRPPTGARWNANAPAGAHGKRSEGAAGSGPSNGLRPKPHTSVSRPSSSDAAKAGKSAAPAWSQRKSHSNGAKPAGKAGAPPRNGNTPRTAGDVRPGTRTDTRPGTRSGPRTESRPAEHGGSRKPAGASSARPSNGKRFTPNARPSARPGSKPSQGTKKRG